VKVPPELVKEWMESTCFLDCNGNYHDDLDQRIANKAAQWAADQELEACCEWLEDNAPAQQLLGHTWVDCEDPQETAKHLRIARRPKPPTLAEQGMEALRSTMFCRQCDYDALFAAINRLAELEAQQ
jgi:hypothetical protein